MNGQGGDDDLDFSFEVDVNSMNKDTSDEYAEQVPPATASPGETTPVTEHEAEAGT